MLKAVNETIETAVYRIVVVVFTSIDNIVMFHDK